MAVVAYIGKAMTAVGEIPNKCKWSDDVKGVERMKLAKEKKFGASIRRSSNTVAAEEPRMR